MGNENGVYICDDAALDRFQKRIGMNKDERCIEILNYNLPAVISLIVVSFIQNNCTLAYTGAIMGCERRKCACGIIRCECDFEKCVRCKNFKCCVSSCDFCKRDVCKQCQRVPCGCGGFFNRCQLCAEPTVKPKKVKRRRIH